MRFAQPRPVRDSGSLAILSTEPDWPPHPAGRAQRIGMTPSSASRIAAALLATIAVSACATTNPAATHSSAAPVVPRPTEPAYVAQARADSIRHPYTAADVEFMTHMIGHHAQAIVMSRGAPTHGASASVLTLASRIINAQQDEIATIQRWLADRLQQVPDEIPGMKMNMKGMEHVNIFSSMLTDEQIKQHVPARESEFDLLFLTYI